MGMETDIIDALKTLFSEENGIILLMLINVWPTVLILVLMLVSLFIFIQKNLLSLFLY